MKPICSIRHQNTALRTDPFAPHDISVVYARVCDSNHFVYGLPPYEAADHKYNSDLNRQAVFAKVSVWQVIIAAIDSPLVRSQLELVGA